LPAFYKSTEDEMDEYVFFDDDTPILAVEDLPRRMLHDWSLYNSDSRFVPLELLPMLPNTEADVEVFGSGIMTEDDGSGYCLDGDSDSHTSKSPANQSGGSSVESSVETPQGIHIYLSSIKEWMIEFGASMLFISIRTDGAWYRLGKPSKQYAPWYKPILKTAKLAINIIAMLKNQSRVSKLSFTDVIRKLAVQDKNEPTFISSNLADVERYVVVHGQIILQQFAEYPDDLIRRSAFVIGLSDKMEQRQHTKLMLTKKKAIIKERNLNPRAFLKFEARSKQMRATTTKLIYRIWKEYYSSSDLGSNDCEENDVKEIAEQEDQEQSDDEEDTILASVNMSKSSSPVKIGKARSSRKEANWVGKPSGKLPSGEPLYKSALVHGDTVAVGGAVLVDSEVSDDLPAIIFVEYMFEKSDGTKIIHGRLLERGVQTILGNAADVREVFLILQCVDVELNCVKGSVTVEIRQRPWGHQYRKENAAADEIDRAQAKELEKKQLPSGYFCKSMYSPEKGAFLNLPIDTLGLGTGQCHACKMRENETKKEFELLPSKDGFTYKGVDYFVHDFVYIDPLQLPSFGEEKEVEKFKAGRNKGLSAYSICQILEINYKWLKES
jgi:DNA (cytosine-5)-methyltransferase 1